MQDHFLVTETISEINCAFGQQKTCIPAFISLAGLEIALISNVSLSLCSPRWMVAVQVFLYTLASGCTQQTFVACGCTTTQTRAPGSVTLPSIVAFAEDPSGTFSDVIVTDPLADN